MTLKEFMIWKEEKKIEKKTVCVRVCVITLYLHIYVVQDYMTSKYEGLFTS